MDVPEVGSWAEFALSFRTHRAKFITIAVVAMIVTAAAVVFVNDYRDKAAQIRELTAALSTTSEKVRQIGESTVAQGHVVDDVKAQHLESLNVMGKQITDYMNSNNAALRAIFTAQGRIEEEVRAGHNVAVTPDATGGFHGVDLVQARTGPPTAQLSLNYNPSATDPTKRLLSTWTNYREDFYPSLGEWTKKDKGFVAAFRLRREIFRPDPNKPGEMIKVGDEAINLNDARADYSAGTFESTPSLEVPRWSFIGGFGRDFGKDTGQSRVVPVGILGYRVADHWGAHAGAVGNTFIVGASLNFSIH